MRHKVATLKTPFSIGTPVKLWCRSRSYSNLAKDGIKFLKGIQDANDTLEPLTMTVIHQGSNTYEIQVKNGGDIACLPALLAIESGSEEVEITYRDFADRDITAAMQSEQGYVYHDDYTIYETELIKDKLLQPGNTFSVFATWISLRRASQM